MALASIFSLSVLIIIVAIIRVVQTSATTQHVDPVWLALWSMIEASVGKSPSGTSRVEEEIDCFTAVVVSCLPSLHILITKRAKTEYIRKASTTGSNARNRFSQFKSSGIRLDPLHRRGLSDLENLTRPSGEHYAQAEREHKRESLISSNKLSSSESSILKANIRVRNEFVSNHINGCFRMAGD